MIPENIERENVRNTGILFRNRINYRDISKDYDG